MTYRSNVTDNEQNQVEKAADDSAIRIQLFDGKEVQTGETKFVRAYDNQAQGNNGGQVTSSIAKYGGSVIGQHNDKAHIFESPGKA